MILKVVSTHSHPKVAAEAMAYTNIKQKVSTHSHPKVAAMMPAKLLRRSIVSTHSHPKVAAYISRNMRSVSYRFQHTATRRWLHWLG